MASLRAAKKELRKIVSHKISGISGDAILEQSSRATATLLARDDYKAAERISVYLSMEGKEIQTNQIVKNALRGGKRVFVPYTHKVRSKSEEKGETSVMDMLALKDSSDFEELDKDRWGIPTPSARSVEGRENCFGGKGLWEGRELDAGSIEGAECINSEQYHGGGLDLIVVPGVAFDDEFGRLGHGKGYYDNFFQRLKDAVDAGIIKKMPKLIALALDEQILPDGESVPTNENDWIVDVVITGAGQSLTR